MAEHGPSLLGHFHGQQNCIAHVVLCIIEYDAVQPAMPGDGLKVFVAADIKLIQSCFLGCKLLVVQHQ